MERLCGPVGLPVDQNSSGGIELLQEIEIASIAGQHGTTMYPRADEEENVILDSYFELTSPAAPSNVLAVTCHGKTPT